MLDGIARDLGFLGVMSGPLVRSSYRAGRLHADALAASASPLICFSGTPPKYPCPHCPQMSSYSAADPAGTLPRSAPQNWARRVIPTEENDLGGTCLHRGCVPTKALLHAAEVADSGQGRSTIRCRCHVRRDRRREGADLQELDSHPVTQGPGRADRLARHHGGEWTRAARQPERCRGERRADHRVPHRPRDQVDAEGHPRHQPRRPGDHQ